MLFFENYTLVDLTHALTSKIPTWDNSQGFSFENQEIAMHPNAGTHIDAPALFFKGAQSITAIPLKQLLVPAHVIDVSKKATADYQISPEDIEHYESAHGAIEKGSLVICYTGWSLKWPDPKAYRNADSKGKTHFPTASLKAVEILMKRNIAGIAIDTVALEPLSSSFPGHKVLLGSGKYIIENIANCHEMPPKGAYVIALPLKIPEAEEAPARVIGLVPKSKD